jgi:hypothetical protein
MAASSEEKDYPHLLAAKIAAAQGSKPELIVHAVGGGTIAGKLSNMEPIRTAAADVIVIQLGENDRDPSEDGFEKPYEALITEIKRISPDVKIYCASVWKGSTEKDEMVKIVCQRQGCVFVDISAGWKDPAGSAEAEKRFTNPGVNWHPGDNGMLFYADALWKAIQEFPAMPAANPSAKRKLTAASNSEIIFEDKMEEDSSSKKWLPPIFQLEPGQNGKALAIKSEDATKTINATQLLPADKLKGKKIAISAMLKAENVSAKPKAYNGIKLMLLVTDAEGRKDYPQASIDVGTFDWKKVEFFYTVPDMAVSVQLTLGLELVSGKIWFDEVKVRTVP